jgi:hypothetical protein
MSLLLGCQFRVRGSADRCTVCSTGQSLAADLEHLIVSQLPRLALLLAGRAVLDSSAADPGTALAQVWDEAWDRAVAPARATAPVALGSSSCFRF